MRIDSIELIGYIRLGLNNIDRLVITPTEIIQFILGTNGSGKSSVIKELSPLPADLPAAYKKGGSKTIRITNLGNKYILTSAYVAGKPNHSFKKNDEELNQGGTVTVQRDLVRQEFRYTPMIHELLIGNERFHLMSSGRRREWLTQLSDVSYDYALDVYEKLRVENRDFIGLLKKGKQRLVTESGKTITIEEENKLRQELEITHQELNMLIGQIAPLDKPIAEYENDRQASLEELTKLSQRLLRMRVVAPYGSHPYGVDPTRPSERDDWGQLIRPSFSCVEEVDTLLDRIRHDITAKETMIHNAVTEHGKLTNTIKILVKAGEAGVKSLHDKIVVARDERNAILQRRKLKIEGIEPVNALSAIDSVHEILVATFSAIPENENKRFSQQRLQEINDSLLKSKDFKAKKVAELTKIVTQKNHIESHKANGNTTCPKCKHSWVIGYSEAEMVKLQEFISKMEEVIAEEDKRIASFETEIAAIQDYSEHYKDYMRCVRNWPILNPLWDYLLAGSYVTSSPRKALTIVQTFRSDLELELLAKKQDDQINEWQQLIISTEQLGDANLSDTQQKLDDWSHVIDERTSELTKLKNGLGDFTIYRRQLAESIELGVRIKTLMDNIEQTNTDMIEMIRRDTLNHCVRQLQKSLALKQDTLSAAISQKAIIDDLQNQILQWTVEEEASRLLMKALSPTDGLIAEGMMGFIRNFITQMNGQIKKIWSYPLQVKECNHGNDDDSSLDYKFPLMVNTKDNVVPDVKDGSSGMREIIDLAFRLTAMKYLGLNDMWLILDEWGNSFDEGHRVAATLTIKNLVEANSFSQLFMVSHYANNYGAFAKSQVCVLDARNISIPSVHNQHVIIA